MSLHSKTMFCALAVGTLLVGCGSDAKTVCSPGASVACVGAGGCSGGQACNAAGTGFAVCACGVADAGPLDAGPEDAGQPDDGGPTDGGPVCLATADYGVASPISETAFLVSGPPVRLIWAAGLNADLLADTIAVELYEGSGAFASTPIAPGTYPLTGDELNYATCGTCIFLRADLDADTGTSQTYMATGGTVTITSVSPNLTGTLSDLTFEHVEVDPTTYVSTPVGDGCVSALTSLSFDAPVTIR